MKINVRCGAMNDHSAALRNERNLRATEM